MEGLDNVRSKFNFSKFFHTIPSNNFKSKLFLDLEAPLPRIINSRSLYPFSLNSTFCKLYASPGPHASSYGLKTISNLFTVSFFPAK